MLSSILRGWLVHAMRLTCFLLVFAMVCAQAETRLLCTPEASAGLHWDQKTEKYKSTRFNELGAFSLVSGPIELEYIGFCEVRRNQEREIMNSIVETYGVRPDDACYTMTRVKSGEKSEVWCLYDKKECDVDGTGFNRSKLSWSQSGKRVFHYIYQTPPAFPLWNREASGFPDEHTGNSYADSNVVEGGRCVEF